MTREPSRLWGWHGMALTRAQTGMAWPGMVWHYMAWYSVYQSTPVGHVGVAVRRTIAANMLSRINAR